MILSPPLRTSVLAILCFCLSGCANLRQVVEKQQRNNNAIKEEEWVTDPFTPPQRSGKVYNAGNAYTLAKVCQLAFQDDKSTVVEVCREWKLEVLFADLRKTHTQYIILGNKDFTVLAFRATQSKLGDFVTVLKQAFYETPAQADDRNVYKDVPGGHAGFRASAADAVMNGLIEDIRLFRAATKAGTNAPLFLTGHSLGGGVALLARPPIEGRGIKVDSIYLYGAPIALVDKGYSEDAKFRRRYETTFFHRFQGVGAATGIWKRYEHDNVPRLRAASMPYSPPGISYQIFPDGHLEPYPNYVSLGFGGSLGWGSLWLSNRVTPHNMEKSYLPALKIGSELR